MHLFRSLDTKPIRHDAKRAVKQAGRRPAYPIEFRAQFGEDALLWLLNDERLDGFFIEAGAFDGYHASVTYALECLGWHGLLVEPHPTRAEECRVRRPHSRVVQAALGASTGHTPFVQTDDDSGGMFSHVPHTSGLVVRKTLLHRPTITVPLTTLNDLLRDHDGDIHAMALDVEGFEVAALSGLDLQVHPPRVLLIEDNPRRPNPALQAHMATQPYTQIAWLRVNRVYARSDLAPSLTKRLDDVVARCGLVPTASSAGQPLEYAQATRPRLEAWRTLKARMPGSFTGARTYDLAVSTASDDAVFVEVGSGAGLSAYYMATQIRDSGRPIRFFCVDEWSEAAVTQNVSEATGTPFEAFLRNVADVQAYLEPLRTSSREATTHFDDASCQFVFLNAGVDYAAVGADIALWWPKIAAGGMLAGNAYDRPEVSDAVDQTFGASVERVGAPGRRHWRVFK